MQKKKREFRLTSPNGWSLKLCASYKLSLKLFTDTNKTCSLIYWGYCPHWKKIKQKTPPSPPLPTACPLLSEDTDHPPPPPARGLIPWDSANPLASLSGPPQRAGMASASCAAELMSVSPKAAAGRIPELSCSNYSGCFLAFFQNRQLGKPVFHCRPKYISKVIVCSTLLS